MRFEVEGTYHNFSSCETKLKAQLKCIISKGKNIKEFRLTLQMFVFCFRIPQYFHIDSRTGAVSSQQSLNHEHIALFEFLVLSRDQGDPARSSVTKVKVSVLDVNDERPVFEKHNYEITLTESAPPSFIFQIKVIMNWEVISRS